MAEIDSTTNTAPMKRCKECGQEKPATLEYFWRKNKNGGYVLLPRCITCMRSPASVEVDRLASLGLKRCSTCNQEKPTTTEFFPRIATRQKLGARCKVCMRSPEALEAERERGRKDRLDPQKRERQHRSQREWEARNSEKKRLIRQQIEAQPNKECILCHRIFPTADYPRFKHGHRDHCAKCFRQTIVDTRARKAGVSSGMKRCTKCGEVFPSTADHFFTRPNGRTVQPCRKCHSVAAHENYERDPVAVKQKVKEWQSENPDKVRGYKKKWERNNAPRIRHMARVRYARGNGIERLNTHNRRAREKKLDGRMSGAQWNRALRYFDYRCAICGRKADMFVLLSPDHWVAIARNDIENLGTSPLNIIPMCHTRKGGGSMGSCNNRKSKRLPLEWLSEYYTSKEVSEILARIQTYFESLK